MNVNVKTDNGIELDAGVKDGHLQLDPNLNADPQGGVEAERSVNDNKVIDTGSILR